MPHFELPYALFLAFIAILSGYAAMRSARDRKNAPSFPSIESVTVLFHENRASAYSQESLYTRIYGANNCLMVTVTDGEVWLRLHSPFNLIPPPDVVHRISRDSIISAEILPKESLLDPLGRPRVFLTFQRTNGESCCVSLRLKEPKAFLGALHTSAKSASSALTRATPDLA